MTASLHRDVVARGIRVRVEEAGAGPPVVFIHGLFVDHATWDGVLAELMSEMHCVAPDLPGFGESEKPPPSRFDYDVDAFTEVIVDLYAGLGLGRAALVGHGLGGAIALNVAARHPELVSRLVLIDAQYHVATPTWDRRLAQLPFVGGLLFKQLYTRITFRAFFRERVLSGRSANVTTERVDRYYDLFSSPAARGSALAALRASSDTRKVAAQTSRVQPPTLVVWGRHDKALPAAFGQRLAREIRGAGFVLLDAGHAPQEECPVELTRAIVEFLRDDRPSRQ